MEKSESRFVHRDVPAKIPLVFSPGYRQHVVHAAPEQCARGEISFGLLQEVVGQAGCKLYPVQQDWEHGTPEDWKDAMVKAARRIVRPHDPVLLMGFSFGGPTAIKAAAELQKNEGAPRPLGVVGASTSPAFSDVYATFTNLFAAEWEDAWYGYNPHSIEGYGSPLPKLDLPVQLLTGQQEPCTIHYMAEAARDEYEGSWGMIPGVRHDMEDSAYLRRIVHCIDALLREADYLSFTGDIG